MPRVPDAQRKNRFQVRKKGLPELLRQQNFDLGADLAHALTDVRTGDEETCKRAEILLDFYAKAMPFISPKKTSKADEVLGKEAKREAALEEIEDAKVKEIADDPEALLEALTKIKQEEMS